MSGHGDDRSIGLGARPDMAGIGENGNQSIHIGGGVNGGIVVAGHGNTSTLTMTQVQRPPAHEVDVAAEIAGLRALMETMAVAEKGRRALADAGDAAAEPKPDKAEVAGALERAVKASKEAADFAENADKIKERVVRIAAWVGPLANGALALLGLTF